MATDDVNNYTFEENPREYCRALYEVFDSHNNTLSEKVEINRAFYNGICAELEKRKKAKNAKRSSIFVHGQRPSIETGESAIIDALEEGFNNTVQLIPTEGNEDQKDIIDSVAAKFNDWARKDGFLTSKFREWMHLSRLAPVAFLFVGWDTRYERKYEIAKGPIEQARKGVEYLRYLMSGGSIPPPEDRVIEKWDITYDGPYTEILDYDEILYDPKAHTFQEGRAVIRKARMTTDELRSAARDADWNMNEVERMRVARDAIAGDGADSLADKEREALDNNTGLSFDGGKYLVCEFYLPVLDDEGRKKIRKYYLGENYYVLSGQELGEDTFLSKFPFVPFATHRMINQIEGVPHVELSMPLQKLYNGLWNAAMDILSYNTLKRIMLGNGIEFREQPKLEPMAFWKLAGDISQIKELDADSASLPALLPLIVMVAQKIDQVHNTPDFAQAKEISGKDEKVFQTRLRAEGSARRARTEFKEAGEAIIGVAELVVELHRIHREPEWIFDAQIDVPALTGNYTPQEEQQKLMAMVDIASGLDIYKTPIGRVKFRNLLEQMYSKLRIRDIDKILQNEEELKTEDMLLQLIDAMQNQQNIAPQSGAGNEVAGDSGAQQTEAI